MLYIIIAGYSNNCKIDIQLVGPEDGRRELVRLAQNLSREVATHQRKLEDITIQHIDNILQGILLKFKFHY